MKIKISLNNFKASLQKTSASDDIFISMEQVPEKIKEILLKIKSKPIKIQKGSVTSVHAYSFYFDDFYADPSTLQTIAQANGFMMTLGGSIVITFATNKLHQ